MIGHNPGRPAVPTLGGCRYRESRRSGRRCPAPVPGPLKFSLPRPNSRGCDVACGPTLGGSALAPRTMQRSRPTRRVPGRGDFPGGPHHQGRDGCVPKHRARGRSVHRLRPMSPDVRAASALPSKFGPWTPISEVAAFASPIAVAWWPKLILVPRGSSPSLRGAGSPPSRPAPSCSSPASSSPMVV